MKLRNVNASNAYIAFRGLGWMLLLLIHIPSVQSQPKDSSTFIEQYTSLINSDIDRNDADIDATVNHLVARNAQENGTFDSLVVSLLIWHYQLKADRITPSDRLLLLNAYRKIIGGMKNSYPSEAARFYSLYIPVFRYHYQADSVAYMLDKVEQLLKLVTFPVKTKIGWFYDKGRLAFGQGDYEAASTFTMRGLEYLNQHFPNETRMKYLLMNAIGIGYRRMGKADEAITWYEDILKQREDEVHTVRMTGALLNNLGLAYKDCGEWDNAIRRLSDAITYYSQTFSPTYEDIGSGYDNIAICYQSKGDLVTALRYSQKSLDFIRTNLGPNHPDLLLPMNSITSTYLEGGNWKAALDMNLKAQALMRELGWKEDDPAGDYYLADGFDVFAYARDIQRARYDTSSDPDDLRAAIKAGGHFMALTDYAYDHLKNDLSKELFQAKHGKVFSACIRDVYDLYQKTKDRSLIELAFTYSEKFKSLELLYAAQKDRAEYVDRYRLLNQEFNSLTDSIRYYEEILYAVADDSQDHVHATSALYLKKEALYQWKERVKKEHADYYQLIYHPEPMTITELQQALEHHDQCMVSYHLSDDAVYMIVISKDSVHFHKKEFQEDLGAVISRFRNALYGYFADTTFTDSSYLHYSSVYVETSALLYNILLAPLRNILKKRVVIIVDKSLGYIPFDLLLTQTPRVDYHYRDHHYVLHDHAISYSYSARLWMDMRMHTFSRGYRLLAMAPSFKEAGSKMYNKPIREGLGPLFYNLSETNHIHRVFSGKMLKGQQASKSNFIKYCSRYPLIHLATHSKANDDQGDFSFLAFTDTGDDDFVLLASEIYNLTLEAELVTLSACETGTGELKSGEGIISLARAFTYAGARSIVSSLWSVNDKSTSIIMTAFYQYLKAGDPKDLAMQKAKLDFITTMGHTDAHPFFWGSFICVGDMTPVAADRQPISGFLIPVAAIAILILFIFFIKKRFTLGTTFW